VSGVTSGSTGVEVRLETAPPVTIEVRDQHDRLVEEVRYSVFLSLAGHEFPFLTRGDRPGVSIVRPCRSS
jgi:hypothetical protein